MALAPAATFGVLQSVVDGKFWPLALQLKLPAAS
jgi:hypothetical protein